MKASMLNWMGDYISNYYLPVMAADNDPDRTLWLTNKEAGSSSFLERESSKLIVFKRKTDR